MPGVNLPARQDADASIVPLTPEIVSQKTVAAFVEGAEAFALDKPSGALCGRVGNRAKALFKEGKDVEKLLIAAYALGGSEFNDLDTAYRKVDARMKGVSRDDNHRRAGLDRNGIRSPADQRIAEARPLYEMYKRQEQENARG